jgi:integrase
MTEYDRLSKRMNFTKASIDVLPSPPKARDWYYDLKEDGLALCITQANRRSFYFYKRVAGQPKQIKLGEYPVMTVEQARLATRQAKVAADQGTDPVTSLRRPKDEWTFSQLGEYWIRDAKGRNKRTWEYDAWMLRKWLAPLQNLRLSAITKPYLIDLHSKIGVQHGKPSANRAMELVRAMFAVAIVEERFIGRNPVDGIRWYEKPERERRIEEGEMEAFFRAVMDEPSKDMRDYVLLSLFTGARQGNVLAMRWEEIDFQSSTWVIPRTKNGKSHRVPLGDFELEILKQRSQANSLSPWVFPTRSVTGHMVEPKGGWRRIIKRANLKNLRPHDLRRTLGSWMADENSSLHIIGKVLGHLNPRSTEIYARLSVKSVRLEKDKASKAILQAAKIYN